MANLKIRLSLNGGGGRGRGSEGYLSNTTHQKPWHSGCCDRKCFLLSVKMLCTNCTSFYSNLMHHFIVLYSNRLGPMCEIIVERSLVIRINIDRLLLLHLLFRFLPPPPLPPPVLVWSYFSLVEKGTLVVPTYDRAKKRTQLNQTYLQRSIEHGYV